jgi:hypothetical protein
MRFSLPDLVQNDRAGTRRWNDHVASTVTHFFFFTHHQKLSAQRSGISAIVARARRYFDAADLCPSAIHRHPAWQGVVR